MKFALLGLALTATTAQGQDQYNSPSYSRQGYNQERGYGEEPSYGQRPSSGYDQRPSTGYGQAPSGYDQRPSTGYGQAPSRYDQRPSTGYGQVPSGYGKPPSKQPSYGQPPVVTGDPTKKHFDQYYDNLKFCSAETTLAQCIIASQSRDDCVSENRINTCTSQFISNLCTSIDSTTTGSYDNGYFKATSNTCLDAALADSLLVYNKLIREADRAFIASPQFDEWSFATIKLALSTTRTHADCVIKSFFNYLNGCARAHVLRKRDLECLDTALKTDQCKWGKETGDGWNIPGYLEFYKDLIEDLYPEDAATPNNPSTKSLIDKLLEEVDFQGVEVVNADYDYKDQTTSVNVKNEQKNPSAIKTEGTNIDEISFHLPLDGESQTVWKQKKDVITPVKTIYDTCEKHFDDSKTILKDYVGGEWKEVGIDGERKGHVRINDKDEFECISDGTSQATCKSFGEDKVDDNKGKNIITCGRNKATSDNKECVNLRKVLGSLATSDKCFAYNGYSITFLDNGATVPLKIETVKYGKTNSYKASWSEPHSCNSHLTQWKQSIACCKSYATALREYQSDWDKKNRNNYGYSKDTKNERPTTLPDSFDGKKTVFEKILTSSSKSGAVASSHQTNLENPGIKNLEEEVTELESVWANKLKKLAKKNVNSSPKISVNDAILYPGESEPTETSCYLSSSSTYSHICTSLKRSWEPDTVIPIVNSKCYPQACILSQLSKCSDIPEKKAGYDYIAQPQPGYNGYRPSYVQRTYLSLESSSTGVLAVAGFASGAAVVVIAQLMLKAREMKSSTSSSSYLLV